MSWHRKSFEVLPALSLRGRPLRAHLRTVIVAWMFGIVWFSCVSGSQFTIFARMLGMGDKELGWLAAIPFAATFAQLFAAIAIERTGVRRQSYLFYGTLHRALWLVIAAIPLLLGAGRAAVVLFLCIYGIGMGLMHLSTPSWTTWMGDLVPRRIRGRFFATRTALTIPIRIGVVVAAGLVLDLVTNRGKPLHSMLDQPLLLWTICGLFAIGGVCGIINVMLFRRVREIVTPQLAGPPAAGGAAGWRALPGVLTEPFVLIRQALKERVFRHYAMYGATIAFAIAVGGQFWMVNALENLHMSKLGANLVFIACPALAGIATVRLWGRVVDRWGRRPTLIVATIAVIFAPAGWFLIPAASPQNTWAAYLLGASACLFGGTMWYGINMAQINVLLSFSDSSGRSKYVAAFWAVTAVGGFVGGWAGGQIAHHFRFLLETPIHVGPFLWKSYHMNFLASALMRAAAIFWLLGMPDPGSRPVRDLFRHMRLNVYNTVATRLFWPARAFGAWREHRRNGRHRRGRRAA